MNEDKSNQNHFEALLRANYEKRIELLDKRIRDLKLDLSEHGDYIKRLETRIGVIEFDLKESEKNVQKLQRANNLLNTREQKRKGVLVPNGLKSTAEIPVTHEGLPYVHVGQGGSAGLEKK